MSVGAGWVFAERYRIDRLIGQGGMGSVYAAFDLRLERTVAVKVLRDLDEKESLRILREAKASAQIHSPHVVAIHDVGTEGGAGYLVYDLLTGFSLDEVLRRDGRLDPARVVRLGAQACKALSTVHALGIIHRDIKPSNLFLEKFEDGSDRLVLIDFGIAKHLIESDAHLTITGTIRGTPGYMAPEQARGDPKIDPRSDLFSLGSTLFHMLTGRPPFLGDHLIAVLAKVLLAEATFPEGFASPELEAVILRCLAKDPEARYPSAVDLMAALLSTPEGHETSDGRKPPSRQAVAQGVALDSASIPTFQPPPELCVMLVAAESRACDPSDATIEIPVTTEDEALHRIAERHGTRLTALTNGSLVAGFASKEIALDQAARAARCALALATRLPGRSIALTRGRGEIAGRVPFGEALDRAAELLRAATGAERIAVDEEMAGLLDDRFEVDCDDLGLALRAERGLFEGSRTLLGGPMECVGRERELSTLLAIFAECVEDSIARVTLITGPAGIGKSRVARELVQRLRRGHDAFKLWVGRGDPASEGSAFDLLAQILRSAAGANIDDPIEDRRTKILALAARRIDGEDAIRVAEFLGEIMESPFPDNGRAELRAAREDPALMNGQMLRAWDDLLSAECGAQPILMVIEDLHLADPPSIQFLDAALQRQRDQPWMLLALGRPEVHERFPRLWASSHVPAIRLGELSRKASERLVRQGLGNATPAEVVDRIVQGASGNALYLKAMICAAAQAPEAPVPPAVLAMVRSRLATLPAFAQKALRAASVFGQVFWAGGVAHLLGEAKLIEERLSTLVEREVICKRSESRFQGEEEYAFASSLVRDACYTTLTDEDRRSAHRLAAAWLSAAGETHAATLAEHRDRGGEADRVATEGVRSHTLGPGPPRAGDAKGLRPARAAHQDLERYLDQAGLSLGDESGPLLSIDRKPDCRLPLLRLSAILLEPEEKPLSMQTMATVVFQKQASPLYSLEGTLDEPHHVLALFRSPPGAGVYREWHELATRRHVYVSPVSPSALRAAVEKKRAAAHLVEILRRARHDPFELEGRVATDIDFFGSREELRTFLHQVDGAGAGIGLFGLEKWGTTSLLIRFRAELGDRISAFVDLAALPSISLAAVLSAIHEDLAHALRDKAPTEQTPSANIEDALRRLVEIGHARHGARPVIFLDRADELSRVERCDPEILVAIARALYRLALPQAGRAGAVLVFGGREDHIVASRVIGAHRNPLSGAVAVRYAPFFSREEMSDFMQRLGSLSGLSFSEAALNEAFTLTGGHKYLTRRLGSLIHQRQSSGASDRVEVTPDLISACAASLMTRHHDYFDAVVERAPPALRDVLVRLAARPTALSELLGAVAPKESRDILAALKFADDYRLVAERDGRYQLTVGIFEHWLRVTHDPNRKPESAALPPPPLPPLPAHEEIQWLEELIREGFSSPHELELLARTLRIAPAETMRSNMPLRVQISDLMDWAVKHRRFGELRDAVQRERPAFFHEGERHTAVSQSGIGALGRRSGQRS